MNEGEPTHEHQERDDGPSIEEMVEATRGELSPEDLADLSAMEDRDEALMFLYVALPNPEEFMIRAGLVEGFRAFGEDEIAARSVHGYRVDEIDEQARAKRADLN